MTGMFAGATTFSADLSGWQVGQVTSTFLMFAFAVVFDSDLSAWQVGQVTDAARMFDNASTFRQNLCPWGGLLGAAADVQDMFVNTNCPFVSDPSLTAVVPGPFCFAC